MNFLPVFVAILAGIAVGAVVHELCHYIVLRIGGRNPAVHPPRIEAGRIVPRVTFDRPAGEVPRDVRVAAVAPAVGGVALLPVVAIAAVTTQSPLLMGFGVGVVIWTMKLSPQDRRLARGISG